MDRIASAAGARVVVHDFHFKPLPDEEGFSVAPGYTTAISLQKVLQEKESILKKKINLPQLAYSSVNLNSSLVLWPNIDFGNKKETQFSLY
jgi:hypothetical protein